MLSNNLIEAQYPLGEGDENNVQAVIPMMNETPMDLINLEWENGKYGNGSVYFTVWSNQADFDELSRKCMQIEPSSYQRVCSSKLMIHMMTLFC